MALPINLLPPIRPQKTGTHCPRFAPVPPDVVRHDCGRLCAGTRQFDQRVYGRLDPNITAELTRLRVEELRTRVDALIQERHMLDVQARELRHCSRALQYSSITLETAPQNYMLLYSI